MDGLAPTARWTVMQPWRGLFGVVVTLGLAFTITSIFDIASFNGIVALWAMSMVPTEAVMGMVWGGQYPPLEKTSGMAWAGAECPYVCHRNTGILGTAQFQGRRRCPTVCYYILDLNHRPDLLAYSWLWDMAMA